MRLLHENDLTPDECLIRVVLTEVFHVMHITSEEWNVGLHRI